MLEIDDCCLAVVDVQDKLAQLMHGREALFKNVRILIQAAQTLEMPILWCQQVPEALGPTIPEIAELLAGVEPINKAAFSCCGADQFRAELNASGRKQVLICGIEAHICVYQSAIDLRDRGFHVNVVADAVSSRMPENRQIALNRLSAEGIGVSSVEMALFELLRTAEHPKFRQIARLVK